MRLLLVEDDPTLARHLRNGLREEGYAVDWCDSAQTADEQIFIVDYDLVILDVMLPDGNGFELLGRWRSHGKILPVLFLTARDTTADKVEGLDRGGDDYLTKPFRFEELLARLRSLLRRRHDPPAQNLQVGELFFDRTARRAEVKGQVLNLTAKEMALFEVFLLHPRRIFDRHALAEKVWDESFSASSNVIDVLISRLRKKIRMAGGGELIHTAKGQGYVLQEHDEGDER